MNRLALLLPLLGACVPELVPPVLADNPSHDFDGDGYTEAMGDCDDLRDAVFPTANERCDGLDNDCDGEVDGARAIDRATWFADGDGDGFGSHTDAVRSCEAPSGYVLDHSDCDDTDPDRHPETPWYQDADGDGFGTATRSYTQCHPPNGFVSNADDCDDTDAAIHPSTTWYLDADGDGAGGSETTVEACEAPASYVLHADDCDDADPARAPSLAERCRDGIDQDCDGVDATCLEDIGVVDAASTILMGERINDDFGRTLITVADELWVAAPNHTGGRVYRLDLPLSAGTIGASSNATLLLDATSPTERAGAALQALVSSSGVAIAVGRPGDAAEAGRVSIWSDATATGSQLLDDATGQWTGDLGDASGASLAALPLQGTDGLLVGAPGAARVYLLAQLAGAQAPADAHATLTGSEQSRFGSALTVGDLDGDGVDDVVVAAEDEGAVYVFSGADLAADTPFATFFAPIPRRVGEVAVADLDHDGQQDLLIGSPDNSVESTVWGLRGPLAGSLSPSHATSTWVAGPASAVGSSFLTGYDVDDDGLADVLAGAPAFTTRGGVWLLQGEPDLSATTPALRGAGYTDQLGASMALSATGHLFVGAPGLDRLYAIDLWP